jgi:phosphate transport system ATP-binding protein
MTLPTSLRIVADDKAATPAAISLSGFNAYFGDNCILSDVSFDVPMRGVTCLIGPSGAGKSTLLRSLNRIAEDQTDASVSGRAEILGRDLQTGYPDLTELRRKVGMVFQSPCVFPCSISGNVLFGLRGQKLSKSEKRNIVERCLKHAALWDEVSRRLDASAMDLSLGQQQRLCIARALAMSPDILLLDEPTASVDPVSARAIENLVMELSAHITVIMVTHNIGQAKRIADSVVFLCDGKVVEHGPNSHMFSRRSCKKTQVYITDEFCDC